VARGDNPNPVRVWIWWRHCRRATTRLGGRAANLARPEPCSKIIVPLFGQGRARERWESQGCTSVNEIRLGMVLGLRAVVCDGPVYLSICPSPGARRDDKLLCSVRSRTGLGLTEPRRETMRPKRLQTRRWTRQSVFFAGGRGHPKFSFAAETHCAPELARRVSGHARSKFPDKQGSSHCLLCSRRGGVFPKATNY